ncbi:DUF7701 domain-containing protein [Pseudarthrobacter sp. MM222]|uniref:DUF7701 domain-containing protein n=1 Tax=Pseudarthrobacter sp. MM222 TaxID=3018929 RepID=UPI00221EA46C|nr:hypothetical protein [Pseudarthrobacter sp. MM222]CAI3799481.1 hypothetical protein NKCBBBOE_02337 [Pseudarthrobacter sp. MM222]
MNYVDEVAALIRAEVPPHKLPEEDTRTLFRSYAVLLFAKGQEVTSSDVHNAWVAWMSEREPNHDALVPFDELDKAVAMEDEPYAAAIRAVSRSMARSI